MIEEEGLLEDDENVEVEEEEAEVGGEVEEGAEEAWPWQKKTRMKRTRRIWRKKETISIVSHMPQHPVLRATQAVVNN